MMRATTNSSCYCLPCAGDRPPGGFGDALRRDAEFAVEHRRRRRGAEAAHADEVAVSADPAVPIAGDGRLDADARRRAEHGGAVVRPAAPRTARSRARRPRRRGHALGGEQARPLPARSTLPSRWR